MVGQLRGLLGTYPGATGVLDSSKPDAALPAILERPGTEAWASAVTTIDAPTVAIPLADDQRTIRLIRTYSAIDDHILVVSIDLRRLDQGRHLPSQASLGEVQIFTAPREVAEDRLRQILEDAYRRTDPNIRDRMLRADEEVEPVVLAVGDRAFVDDAASVAATFGMAVKPVPVNIARDYVRLERIVKDQGDDLVAALFGEEEGENLIWVGDLVASLSRVDLPRSHLTSPSGRESRSEMRRTLMQVSPGRLEPKRAETVYTCPNCQPTVTRAIKDHDLNVGTVAAKKTRDCVCGGHQGGAQSIRLSLALQLAGLENILIIGYQQNFDSICAAVEGAEVRHINNAGHADAAARRADFAVLVTASVMGHSDSQPYTEAVSYHKVPMRRTSGSQMSDVIRTMFDEAVQRRPELRRARMPIAQGLP